MTPGVLVGAAATCALLHTVPHDDGVSPVQKAHGSRPLALVLAVVTPPGERGDAPWCLLALFDGRLGWAQPEADGWRPRVLGTAAENLHDTW